MTPKIKNSIVFIIIAIIMIFVYIFFIKKDGDEALLISLTDPVATPIDLQSGSSLSQDFLSVLLNVKNIQLNDIIFNDPAFASLNDSSILLIPDNSEGRSNPFAPFGSDAVSISIENNISNTNTTPPASSTPPPTALGGSTNPPSAGGVSPGDSIVVPVLPN